MVLDTCVTTRHVNPFSTIPGSGVLATEIAKAGQPCGSWRYWLAVAAVLVPTLPVMVGSRRYLLNKHRERIASNALWGMFIKEC